MALKNTSAVAATFEEPEAAVATASVAEVTKAEVFKEPANETHAEAQTESATEEVKAEAATAPSALAKTGSTAIGAVRKFLPALADLKNQFDPSTLDFNTFKRITVDLSGFQDEKEVELGKSIKLDLYSFNERFVISTGEQGSESDELVRYSLDGKTIDGTDQPVAEYIAYLQSEGYEKAAKKKYFALYGMLVATSVDGKLVTLPDAEQEIVSVQIPPMSTAKFTGYQMTQGVKIAQGKAADGNGIVLTQVKAVGKTTSYAEVAFSAG